MQEHRSHQRCPWVDLTKRDYIEYYVRNWAVPVYDNRRLFACLVLEAAQAGLSWDTVLGEREHYHSAFDRFDPEKVVRYGELRESDRAEEWPKGPLSPPRL